MSNGHGSSRRQAYGRRMKDLRNRRNSDLEVDLEGPSGWSRGSEWDDEQPLHRGSMSAGQAADSPRPR
jgi:hypothetical protein